MKKVIRFPLSSITLTVLTLLSLFLGQSKSIHAQTQFVKEYNLNFMQFPFEEKFAQSIDQGFGGYAIAGGVNNPYNGGFDPALFTVDNNGNIGAVKKIYEIPSHQRNVHVTTIVSAESKSKNGYLLVGNSQNANNIASHQTFLIKTKLNGDVVWSRSLKDYFGGTYTGVTIRAVQQMSNGKVVIVGVNGGIQGQGAQSLIVIKLNPDDGAIDWYEKYNFNSAVSPQGIIEGDSENYYIFGESENPSRNAFIFHITDGYNGPSIQNFKEIYYQQDGPSHYSQITSLIYENNELFVNGHFQSHMNSTLKESIVLFKIDENLNVITDMNGNVDQMHVYTENNSPFMTSNDFVKYNNRFIIHGSRLSNSNNVYESIKLVVGQDGSILNEKIANAEVYRNFSESSYLFNNSIMTGEYTVNGNYRLTKSTLMGNSCDENDFNFQTYEHGIWGEFIEMDVVSNEYIYEELDVEGEDINVPVTNICENCPTPIVENDPITTSTGSNYICAGSSLDLTAPSGYVSYHWLFNGSLVGTSQTLTNVSQGGTYTVVCYDSQGCEVEVSITIIDYSACEVGVNFPEVNYCSLTANSPTNVGWIANPLVHCGSSYSFDWYFNGNLISSGGDYNIPWQGTGLYEVDVNTICGTQSFSQNIVDQLSIELDATIAEHGFAGYIPAASTNAHFKRIHNNPEYSYTEYEITDGNTTTPPMGGTNWDYLGQWPNYDFFVHGLLSVTCRVYDYTGCKVYSNTEGWSDDPTKSIIKGGNKSIEVNTYPNPTTDDISVEIEAFDSEENYELTIFDINGQQVHFQILPFAVNRLDISHLENGSYMIMVQSSNGTHSSKFTKM